MNEHHKNAMQKAKSVGEANVSSLERPYVLFSFAQRTHELRMLRLHAVKRDVSERCPKHSAWEGGRHLSEILDENFTLWKRVARVSGAKPLCACGSVCLLMSNLMIFLAALMAAAVHKPGRSLGSMPPPRLRTWACDPRLATNGPKTRS